MNFIYLITNLKNNKQYIGSHKGDINDKYLGSGKILKYAIKKYGRNNFKRKILEECDPKINLLLEQKYISIYNTMQPKGYNILENGGYNIFDDDLRKKLSNIKKGKKLSEETKRKISIGNKGKKTGPLSIEHKRKISESKKGTIPWNKGKKLTKEHIKKLSISHIGNINSPEARKKMSIKSKGRIKGIEECKNISISKIGPKNPMFGKKPWNYGLKKINRNYIKN